MVLRENKSNAPPQACLNPALLTACGVGSILWQLRDQSRTLSSAEILSR
jgi:hypothetical protein